MTDSDKRKIESRRAEHRCTTCGKPLPEGSDYRVCQACISRSGVGFRKRQEQFKAEGRCVYCGDRDERTLSGKTRCSECAAKAALSTVFKYHRRLSNHCCVRCGKALAKDYFYTLCEECKEKDNARQSEYRKKKRASRSQAETGNAQS